MTVKELIEMLKTCDEESIVYIDYNGDINSINEVCDYSNNCGEVIIVSDYLNFKAMSKFIGVKMIEAVSMTAREANDKGYRIGNHSFEEDGYEVTYPDGYKSWSPAKEFEKAYYKLEDPAGDVLKVNDIKRFISNIENVKVGTKTTNTTLTCLIEFEVHGQAACVKPENFDLNVGSNYA